MSAKRTLLSRDPRYIAHNRNLRRSDTPVYSGEVCPECNGTEIESNGEAVGNGRSFLCACGAQFPGDLLG